MGPIGDHCRPLETIRRSLWVQLETIQTITDHYRPLGGLYNGSNGPILGPSTVRAAWRGLK